MHLLQGPAEIQQEEQTEEAVHEEGAEVNRIWSDSDMVNEAATLPSEQGAGGSGALTPFVCQQVARRDRLAK